MKDFHATIDEGKLNAFLARAVGDLSAGYFGVMVSLGDKLGLYRAMAGAGPLTPREVAARSGTPLTTTHRLLADLVAWGALSRRPDGRYEIGRKLWDLGLLAPVQLELRQVATPFLLDVHTATRDTVHLAVRNTIRGKHVGLPSGQQVARAMRVPVLSNATLGLSADPRWGGEAPLWFYVLKEAELPPYDGERLGPVGGRIVAEVLVGLLQRDPSSYLHLDPAWKPGPPIAPTTGQFGFADLLRYAGAA